MKIVSPIAALLLILLAGCGPNPDRCVTDKALMEDNFNDTACGWDEYDEDNASAGYRGSEFFVAVHQPNTSAVAFPGATFADVSIQAEVRLESGTSDNNFGLLCRFQDMDNFYAFLISSDGYYAIAKVVDGAAYTILSGDEFHLMPTEEILVDAGATNEMHAICAGDQLTLYVNGQQLAGVTDSDLLTGDIGFIVSTYDTAPAEIHFDNLFVQEPAVPSSETE